MIKEELFKGLSKSIIFVYFILAALLVKIIVLVCLDKPTDVKVESAPIENTDTVTATSTKDDHDAAGISNKITVCPSVCRKDLANHWTNIWSSFQFHRSIKLFSSPEKV